MVLKNLLLGSIAIISLGGQAIASVPEGRGEESLTATEFLPIHFVQYAPLNALDMVRRIPGFSIQSDDSGARGFGQARGNVLIDGQRVSAKSNGVEAALGRISSGRVVRLEVIDGSQLDIPGLSGKVVNVVTDGATGIEGNWRWQMRLRENLPPAFNEANLNLSGGRGALSWNLQLDSEPGRGANGGWRRIYDGAGAQIERRKEHYTFTSEEVAVAGSLSWRPASGVIANLNGRAEIWQGEERQIAKTFPVNASEGRRVFRTSKNDWEGEIGGDYEFGVGPGRLKFIGLARHEHSPPTDLFFSGALDGAGSYSSEFQRGVDEGEYILRSEYALSTVSGHDWQVSAEGAFNFLDAESALREAVNGGPMEHVPLDLEDVRVEERRGEVTVTHARRFSPRLTLQVSAGAEYSELSQSGDARNTRSFARPKGFAAMSWQRSDTLKLVGRVERRVGQLDFSDFTSSVNLDLGNDQAGNVDLVPEQSWRFSVEAEQDLGVWGATTVRALLIELEDVVDQVRVGAGTGPGNLPAASAYGLETDATIRLSRLGFSGAELTFSGQVYGSRLDDPITGVSRPINGHVVYGYNLELRQDVPGTDIAWGLGADDYRGEVSYRISEATIDRNSRPGVRAYLEHKDLQGLTARATLSNLANKKDTIWRHVYSPDRNGMLVRSERSSRAFGPVFTLEVRGSF